MINITITDVSTAVSPSASTPCAAKGAGESAAATYTAWAPAVRCDA